jgi:hypothetical protein
MFVDVILPFRYDKGIPEKPKSWLVVAFALIMLGTAMVIIGNW